MSIIGSWQWFVPRLPVPALFTHMALRWRDKRLVFDSWQRGVPSFFTPVWHYLPPPLGRWARVFAPESVHCVYQGLPPVLFLERGRWDQWPWRVKVDCRLHLLHLVFLLYLQMIWCFTLCSVSLDHCYLSSEWILHFSTWEPKISLLVTSAMSLKSWWCQRPTTSITVSIFNKTKNNYTRNCFQKSNQEK